MTFYWWSHWFWITLLLCNLLFSTTFTFVHTYPSQEFSSSTSSIELNSNSQSVVNKQQQPFMAITKLYQQTTTLTWATAAPFNTENDKRGQQQQEQQQSESPFDVTSTGERTILQSIVTPKMSAADTLSSGEENGKSSPSQSDVEIIENDNDYINVDEDNDDDGNNDDDIIKIDTDVFEARDNEENIETGIVGEFKRSIEMTNKTSENLKNDNSTNFITTNDTAITTTTTTSTINSIGGIELAKELSNYTNYTSTARVALSTNETVEQNGTNSSTQQQLNITNQMAKSNSNGIGVGMPPMPPKIESDVTTVEWFKTIMAPHSQQQQQQPVQSVEDSLTAPTTAQKVPFTLENVNKEEELRRAENEHRSRKSKNLSADYKHINRYINFSTDTKNQLTRSASTAPNSEFDAEESNISSEALAIQRTYFLDAGAISAICFTIFGICCTVGTIGIVLYRRRYLNKPQTLSEPDSSVYIDDSTMRVSDNSDEMYSLDNDSFLNSLEAMTIQNYWTDTVKHTKL